MWKSKPPDEESGSLSKKKKSKTAPATKNDITEKGDKDAKKDGGGLK